MFKFFKPKFERAIEPELPVLYRVAKRMSTSSEDAEDLVSQTLLQSYKSWHTFDGRYLRSWLIKIMRHERGRVREFPNRVEWEIEELREIPYGYTTWDLVYDRLESQKIRDAMDQLADGFRLVIQLCDVEGMSYEEASIALDIPIGTIRSRLSRARSEIRKNLLPAYKTEVVK